jgi:hypothetical protein
MHRHIHIYFGGPCRICHILSHPTLLVGSPTTSLKVPPKLANGWAKSQSMYQFHKKMNFKSLGFTVRAGCFLPFGRWAPSFFNIVAIKVKIVLTYGFRSLHLTWRRLWSSLSFKFQVFNKRMTAERDMIPNLNSEQLLAIRLSVDRG